jgi:dCTP deaminase
VILSGTAIAEYVENGLIDILPLFDPMQLRPCGLRVHLSGDLLIPRAGQCVDLSGEAGCDPQYDLVDASDGYTMLPGGFVLASTIERFKLHTSLLCRLDGRSTVARLGVAIHATSSTIDGVHLEPRSIVLEMSNVGPLSVRIKRGHPIGMVTFECVAGNVAVEFEQKQYGGQTGTLPPNLTFAAPPLRELP